MLKGTVYIFNFVVSVVIIALIVFGILRALDMPTGTFLDWIIGILAFVWLVTIVTVPWNIYFESSEVLSEAKKSKKQSIQFDDSNLPYVKKLAFWSLIIAVVLHVISASALYWIAWAQISTVGYVGAGSALFLTFLRPTVRAYQYISDRLSQIKQEIKYPREDIELLKGQVKYMLEDVKELKFQMNITESDSWVSRLNYSLQENKNRLNTQTELLKDDLMSLKKEISALKHQSEIAIQRLNTEQKEAISSLSRDGKFVDNFIDNLAEIVRFIKRA
jgi:hypothetical protein